ncbi:MAG: alpha-ketoacid dehydrogenase subunit beta [Actinobacteria bacterium]|nr:alpha-ketoacid dehydrogenase subunit beta [Actinomycetota bacterium]MBU1494706.1 alpha-ketoacid dehydrogenase subunit beta [Actinomycetota bacterium]
MMEMNMAQAINHGIHLAMAADPAALLIGEDVGRTGGVFRVTDGLLEAFGEERVIDTPVAESGIVGVALGMAVAGLHPIAEIQFMGFTYPAYDQIVSHVGRMRNRSRHRFTAPMVIRFPYGGGIGAAEHHSESTEALYVHTPGVKVVVASGPRMAKGLLLAAVEDPDPVIMLEPIRLYRAIREEVPEGHYTIPIGVGEVVRVGSDVTLIGYGSMLREALRAAETLEAAGASAEVIDLRTVSPLDADLVVASVEKTGRAVVVAEGHRSAGVAAEVAAIIGERALFSLQAPVERVTGLDTVVPLKRAEQYYVPDAARIAAAARRTLEA